MTYTAILTKLPMCFIMHIGPISTDNLGFFIHNFPEIMMMMMMMMIWFLLFAQS